MAADHRDQSLDADIRRSLSELSATARDITPVPTRKWAQEVLQNTPLFSAAKMGSLAEAGAKSFAAYKEKKQQRLGWDFCCVVYCFLCKQHASRSCNACERQILRRAFNQCSISTCTTLRHSNYSTFSITFAPQDQS